MNQQARANRRQSASSHTPFACRLFQDLVRRHAISNAYEIAKGHASQKADVRAKKVRQGLMGHHGSKNTRDDPEWARHDARSREQGPDAAFRLCAISYRWRLAECKVGAGNQDKCQHGHSKVEVRVSQSPRKNPCQSNRRHRCYKDLDDAPRQVAVGTQLESVRGQGQKDCQGCAHKPAQEGAQAQRQVNGWILEEEERKCETSRNAMQNLPHHWGNSIWLCYSLRSLLGSDPRCHHKTGNNSNTHRGQEDLAHGLGVCHDRQDLKHLDAQLHDVLTRHDGGKVDHGDVHRHGSYAQKDGQANILEYGHVHLSSVLCSLARRHLSLLHGLYLVYGRLGCQTLQLSSPVYQRRIVEALTSLPNDSSERYDLIR
mmetsp:Transcript_48251/g.112627  ORF Transcript_48251/g.112627 Transcript_48251/m.112627 type:complete len:372 (-) Transcript_48251:119-1234(-)